MDGILSWMESGALARMIIESAWLFPTLETVHFVGLILLIGSMYVIDLRLIGFASRIPVHAVVKYIPVSIIGFAINLITGSMFLFADPFRYYPKPGISTQNAGDFTRRPQCLVVQIRHQSGSTII